MRKRILLFSLIGCLLFLSVFAAPNVTLTAVNNQLLPLSSSSMPTRKSGEYFVPYAVFQSLGLNTSYNAQQQILLIYNLDNALRFSMPDGYVTDQAGNSYNTPAYSLNGTYYVSVKLVCSCFGMSFSMISGSVPVLRIVSDPSAMTDHAFLSANENAITQAVHTYQNGTPANSGSSSATSGAVQQPDTPAVVQSPVVTPTPEEAPIHPSLVYLAFTGALSEYTPQLLDVLNDTPATFFIAANALPEQDDILRRILMEGHALGLSLTADASVAQPEALLAQLDDANVRLGLACGVQTRLVMIENGADALSDAQQAALKNAGYRLWQARLDGQEHRISAARAAQSILNAFTQSAEPTVIRLRHLEDSVTELSYLLQSMRILSIPASNISITDTPV